MPPPRREFARGAAVFSSLVLLVISASTAATRAGADPLLAASYFPFDVGTYPFCVAIGDLDGDGGYDFVVKHPAGGKDPGRVRVNEGTYKIDAYDGRDPGGRPPLLPDAGPHLPARRHSPVDGLRAHAPARHVPRHSTVDSNGRDGVWNLGPR